MASKAVVASAMGACAVGVAVSIWYIIAIMNDIHRFVDDVTKDLNQFKEKADDVWRELVPASQSYSSAKIEVLLRKEKRQINAAGQQCQCGPPPANCERGLPGPPGEPGEPGRK
ncbi:nematode cuticle collagen domain protein [Ostertagia ostertagi]